jgi:hypothetical protein
MLASSWSISLRPERYQRQVRRFQDTGAPIPRRLPAFCGRCLQVDPFSSFLQGNYTTVRSHQGHWGAAVSHLVLWQHLATLSEDHWYLIVEDDAYPKHKDWYTDLLQGLKHIPEHVTLLYLGWHGRYADDTRVHANDGLPLWYLGGRVQWTPIRYPIGLWAYVMRGGRHAATWIERVTPLERPIDHAVAQFLSNTTTAQQHPAWAAVPSMIQHPGTTYQDSFRVVDTCLAPYSTDTVYTKELQCSCGGSS